MICGSAREKFVCMWEYTRKCGSFIRRYGSASGNMGVYMGISEYTRACCSCLSNVIHVVVYKEISRVYREMWEYTRRYGSIPGDLNVHMGDSMC